VADCHETGAQSAQENIGTMSQLDQDGFGETRTTKGQNGYRNFQAAKLGIFRMPVLKKLFIRTLRI